MPRKFRLKHVKYRHLKKKLNKNNKDMSGICYSALMQLHCHLYKKNLCQAGTVQASSIIVPSCSNGEPLETVNLFVQSTDAAVESHVTLEYAISGLPNVMESTDHSVLNTTESFEVLDPVLSSCTNNESLQNPLTNTSSNSAEGFHPSFSVVASHNTLLTLKHIQQGLDFLKQPWSYQISPNCENNELYKVSPISFASSLPVITHCLCVYADLTWTLSVHGHKVTNLRQTPLPYISDQLDIHSLHQFIKFALVILVSLLPWLLHKRIRNFYPPMVMLELT